MLGHMGKHANGGLNKYEFLVGEYNSPILEVYFYFFMYTIV